MPYIRNYILCLLSIILAINVSLGQQNISSINIKDLEGNIFHMAGLHNQVSVFTFLSPECPISQQVTLELRTLTERFKDKHISFYGVIPGNDYNRDSILKFQHRYKINFMVLLDKDLKLKKALNASVTPEVFVLDGKFAIRYSGAIDDTYIELGKKQRTRHYYLKDALECLIAHHRLNIKHTQAVGCFIE